MALDFDLRKTKFIITKKFRKEMKEAEEVGDWYLKNGTLYIVAYDTGIKEFNQAILFHEFVEAVLMLACMKTWGISPKKVDEFGERPIPLKNFHEKAKEVERMFIEASGENWENYDKFIENLKPKYE